MEAPEDWITAVMTVPTSTPMNGFWNMVRIWVNCGLSRRPSTVPAMISMPYISTANPIMISPRFFRRLFPLRKQYCSTPATPSTAERMVTTLILPPPSPSRDRESKSGVTAAPTLAPMMMPTDCDSVMMPELTNPTTMTVVAEEDCIRAVTTSPSRKPLNLLEVSLLKIVFIWLPAKRSSAWLMTFIPKRNKASPPRSSNTSLIPISAFHPL